MLATALAVSFHTIVAGLLGSLTLLFSIGTVKLLAAHTGRVEVKQVFLSCKPPRI